MIRIDSHQHFWKYHPVKDRWINEDMKVLQRDFLPSQLQPLLQQSNINGCIAVQADQSDEETQFLVSLTQENSFIKGVVGWVNLQADNIEEQLLQYQQSPIIKGFRHILQGETQRDLMLQSAFKRGISDLQKYKYTYDILIYPDQLPYASQLAAEFPQQKFVIDHLAKPRIKEREMEPWKTNIQAIARHPNVYCKLSGLVTEADWKSWKTDDFTPYLDAVVNAFGTHRIMYGSDWPVCLLAASYAEVLDIVEDYFSHFSITEKEAIFGANAARFYNL